MNFDNYDTETLLKELENIVHYKKGEDARTLAIGIMKEIERRNSTKTDEGDEGEEDKNAIDN